MLSKTEKRREEEKRIWKLMQGLGSETIYQPQNMRYVSSFLFLPWKKNYQHKRGFLGTSYLTLPEMEKRTLRDKRRDNPICRCYFSSHLSENFIAVKGTD